jgi:hypothetical protein
VVAVLASRDECDRIEYGGLPVNGLHVHQMNQNYPDRPAIGLAVRTRGDKLTVDGDPNRFRINSQQYVGNSVATSVAVVTGFR